MSKWTSIAIFGIWLGVGLSAFGSSNASPIVAVVALFATFMVIIKE